MKSKDSNGEEEKRPEQYHTTVVTLITVTEGCRWVMNHQNSHMKQNNDAQINRFMDDYAKARKNGLQLHFVTLKSAEQITVNTDL